MLSMFLDTGWMVQKIKYLISTEVAQYGDSHIVCASCDFVLHDALEVNNSQESACFFCILLSSLLPCSHLPLIWDIIYLHMVLEGSSSTWDLSVLFNIQHCIHSVFVSTVDTFVLFVCLDVNGQTDVTVDSLTLCFIFGKFRAHNLAQQPPIMIVDSMDFLRSHQSYAKILSHVGQRRAFCMN